MQMSVEPSIQKKGKILGNHMLRKQMIQSYFSEQQQQFDEKFVDDLFELADVDQQLESIISLHSINLLLSSQPVTKVFLLKLLAHPNHMHIAHTFIHSVITFKTTIYNRAFQLFLIETLPSILHSTLHSTETLKATITYLAFKIRSFDRPIRVTALKALKALGEGIQNIKKEWDKTFKQIIPLMIEKQKLVRQVSYIKGLFLHILEDEFSEVRKICIQTLILFRKYIKPQDLKLITIYMLNDEHEIVRQETLIGTKHLTNQLLVQQDLDTIMMCLRQKRTNMRKYVYETLSMALINDPALLFLIVEKSLTILQTYKSDKKRIYKMLSSLGKKYQNWVQGLIPKLSVLDSIQPNWKNIIYKGKMVFCYWWWNKLDLNANLPFYFSKHMLYIKDVQPYLFQDEPTMLEESQSIDLAKIPKNHLSYFIECQQEISQQFHKTILSVIRSKFNIDHDPNKLKLQLEELPIIYNLKEDEKNLTQSLINIINYPFTEELQFQIISLLRKCINNRQKYQEKDAVVTRNKCTISKMQNNLAVASLGNKFQERVFLRCWVNSLIFKQPKTQYKKLIELSKVKEDDQYSYIAINMIRYSKVECFLRLLDNSEISLDTFEFELKI